MKRNIPVRLFYTIVGVLFIGLAVAFLRIANLGTDPFATFNLGLADFTGIRFGLMSVLANSTAAVIVLMVDKRLIGLGTILNILLVGNVSDIIANFSLATFGEFEHLGLRTAIAVAGVLLLAIGAAMNIVADLGVSPYDALPIVAETLGKGKIKFQYARIILDFSAVGIGFAFGAIVGIFTLVTAFFMGPLLQFFRIKLFLILQKIETRK